MQGCGGALWVLGLDAGAGEADQGDYALAGSAGGCQGVAEDLLCLVVAAQDGQRLAALQTPRALC